MLKAVLGVQFWLKGKVNEFLYDEDGAVDIVAIIILIGIVVVLAVIFRKAIIKLVNDLMTSITAGATDAAKTTE